MRLLTYFVPLTLKLQFFLLQLNELNIEAKIIYFYNLNTLNRLSLNFILF